MALFIMVFLTGIISVNRIEAQTVIASGTCGANLTWELTSDSTLTISGTGAMTNWYDFLSVPWYSYRSAITSVNIGNSVTTIGGYAFINCSGLTSVTIPNSVTSIGDYAFSFCHGLTSVTIPNSVTSMGDYAFSFCYGLTSVTIGNSVTSMGDYAFYQCPGLTSVTIGNSVTSIGDYAFSYCSSLTSITIPSSVTSIGNNAFEGTAWYNNQPNGVVYINTCLYKYKGTMPANTSITIQGGTTLICVYAFYNCSGLTTISIPNSVTSIEKYAFSYCSGLTEITSLAVTPPTLGDYCFYFVPTTIPVHVPCESKTAYQTATGWSNFTNYVGIGQPDTTFINASICYGQTYTQNGFNESIAGQYSRTEQSATGCDSTITLNLVVNPVYNDTINAEIAAGETYNLNGFNESTAGTYTQTLQSVNGCDSIVVLNLSVSNSLNEIETTDFAIYPNPASETINITCGEKINSIEVVDLLGKVVYQGKETTIDVSKFAKGNYFVRVQTDKGTLTRKVIVE